MQDMRQCFLYDSLYVPDTYHLLFTYHFVHENCLCGFVQINTIQKTIYNFQSVFEIVHTMRLITVQLTCPL